MKKTKEELEQECLKMQKLDHWYGFLVVSGALVILFGLYVLDNLTVMFVGMGLALIALFFVAPRIHCPFCGGYLRMKFGLPKTCPHCGQQIVKDSPEE